MMGFVLREVSNFGNSVGNVVKGVGDLAVSAVKGVGDAIVGTVNTIDNTVQAIIKDPLPTLLQVAGASVGIPPYVTAAVITAARGGDLEDIAKTAAISYIASEAVASTNIGKEIGSVTKTAGQDFTNYMMENFSLPPDAAVAIAKAATASLNSSIIGGVSAAITGKSVADGIASGFTSGLIYSSTNSYFDTLNKDPNWGFSQRALDLMKGSTSTVLNTIVSGKGDPAQAIGNYIAFATINMAKSNLSDRVKEAYVNLTTDTDVAKKAQEKYALAKADVDAKINEGEKIRNEINTAADSLNTRIRDEYTPAKTKLDEQLTAYESGVALYNTEKKRYDDNKYAYENYPTKMAQDGYQIYDEDAGTYYKEIPVINREGQVEYHLQFAPTKDEFLKAANAAADAVNTAITYTNQTGAAAQKIYDDNKEMFDSVAADSKAIDEKVVKLNAIKSEVEKPDGTNLAQKLKDAADEYQKKYDAWSKTKAASDATAENYTKALAATATRDATIDALNTGAVTVTGKDANGNWLLSNNMTLTTEGKFIQDGQQLFTNSAGIPQKAMDFKANDGSNVDFNENAGRMAISAITLSELYHGAEKSTKVSQNLEVIEEFASLLEVLPYTAKASQHYGAIRSDLEKAGQPIGVNDLHIAAHARSEGLVVVTNNCPAGTIV